MSSESVNALGQPSDTNPIFGVPEGAVSATAVEASMVICAFSPNPPQGLGKRAPQRLGGMKPGMPGNSVSACLDI